MTPLYKQAFIYEIVMAALYGRHYPARYHHCRADSKRRRWRNRLATAIGSWFTDPGDGRSSLRWDETSLDRFFAPYAKQITASFVVPGRREKVFVLDVRHGDPEASR